MKSLVILKIFALAALVQKFVRMTSDFKKLFTGPGKNYIFLFNSSITILRKLTSSVLLPFGAVVDGHPSMPSMQGIGISVCSGPVCPSQLKGRSVAMAAMSGPRPSSRPDPARPALVPPLYRPRPPSGRPWAGCRRPAAAAVPPPGGRPPLGAAAQYVQLLNARG